MVKEKSGNFILSQRKLINKLNFQTHFGTTLINHQATLALITQCISIMAGLLIWNFHLSEIMDKMLNKTALNSLTRV